MGEGGTIGAPAAIANAISDALFPFGIGIDTLPASPERIFRLVQQANRKQGQMEWISGSTATWR